MPRPPRSQTAWGGKTTKGEATATTTRKVVTAPPTRHPRLRGRIVTSDAVESKPKSVASAVAENGDPVAVVNALPAGGEGLQALTRFVEGLDLLAENEARE